MLSLSMPLNGKQVSQNFHKPQFRRKETNVWHMTGENRKIIILNDNKTQGVVLSKAPALEWCAKK